MNVKELFNLDNKVAVITGGYGHLGEKMSESLAEAGAHVTIAGRNPAKCKSLVKNLGRKNLKVDYEIMDVGSRTSIERAFAKIMSKCGRIDILVNNAYYGKGGNILDISEDSWNSAIDGTINSVFRCTQAVIPHFKNGGNIINIASMYGVVSPDPSVYDGSGFDNPPNYGAGKAGIVQFTKYAAVHLARRKIRVNAVSPGPFPSPKVQRNGRFIKKLVKKVPMGRIGQPDELKGIIVFLASDASSYLTGQNICIDGGWTIW